MNEIWACVYAQNAKYFKIYGLRDAIIIYLSILVFEMQANGHRTPYEPHHLRTNCFVSFRSSPDARVRLHDFLNTCYADMHIDRPIVYAARPPCALKSYSFIEQNNLYSWRSTVYVAHKRTRWI